MLPPSRRRAHPLRSYRYGSPDLIDSHLRKEIIEARCNYSLRSNQGSSPRGSMLASTKCKAARRPTVGVQICRPGCLRYRLAQQSPRASRRSPPSHPCYVRVLPLLQLWPDRYGPNIYMMELLSGVGKAWQWKNPALPCSFAGRLAVRGSAKKGRGMRYP